MHRPSSSNFLREPLFSGATKKRLTLGRAVPGNITEGDLGRYLERFHGEYTDTVERFIKSPERDGLLRYSLLPATVTGYVSTNFGAGFEYRPGKFRIETRLSSRRIEDLCLEPPESRFRPPGPPPPDAERARRY
jgi:hypothetical protein